MTTKYYKYGLRPVIREFKSDYEETFVFDWDTGEFIEDMSYLRKVHFNFSGDAEELTKEEFDAYVEKLKKGRGLE